MIAFLAGLNALWKKISTKFPVQSKMSSTLVEKKQGSFFRALQLLKYEREKIPLYKYGLPEAEGTPKENLKLYEESLYQEYYLYHLIHCEKKEAVKKKQDAQKRKVAMLMSAMYFMSNITGKPKIASIPPTDITLKHTNVESVKFSNHITR